MDTLGVFIDPVNKHQLAGVCVCVRMQVVHARVCSRKRESVYVCVCVSKDITPPSKLNVTVISSVARPYGHNNTALV